MIVIPYVGAALAGLVVGFFVNVVSERFPYASRPLFGRLRCVRGGEPLSVRDYLPVVGYLSQRGVCRHCHQKLPWRFPAVEIFLALAFPLAWPMFEQFPLYIYIINLFYLTLLTTIGVIDWRFRLIFPVMIWFGCLVAIAVALIGGSQKSNLLPDGIGSVLLGALVGGGIFYFIYLVAYAMYKRRALGFGDVLLAILIGCILGFPRAVSALFLGAVLGGMVALGYYFFGRKRWRDFVPYGTTLCLGVILIIMFGQAVWQWGPLGILTGLLQLLFQIITNWVYGPNG